MRLGGLTTELEDMVGALGFVDGTSTLFYPCPTTRTMLRTLPMGPNLATNGRPLHRSAPQRFGARSEVRCGGCLLEPSKSEGSGRWSDAKWRGGDPRTSGGPGSKVRIFRP